MPPSPLISTTTQHTRYEGSSWTEAERGELRKSGGMAGLLARTSAVKTSSPFALAETNDAQCAAPSGNNGAGDIHVTSDPPRSTCISVIWGHYKTRVLYKYIYIYIGKHALFHS